jgi:lipopolysaccharide/colanic/teichoic acid biosynthesis glycosyltransferase
LHYCKYTTSLATKRSKTMAKNLSNPIALRNQDKASMRMGIYDVHVFTSLIRHERSRADRTGKAFTLVAFSFDGGSVPESRVQATGNRLSTAMRSIDEIGWLEDGRIGVLLPATMLEGAHQYARRAAAGEKSLSYKVYVYPDHWMSDYDERSEKEEQKSEPDISDAFSIAIPSWKRALDIFGSVLGIVVLWPIFLVVAAYIKIVSPGPALFKQKRVGRGGKLFTFIKFRTMKHGNNQGTHQDHIIKRIRAGESLAKLDEVDSRIIPGGKFLRKACIDELPQLLNVLLGDMSLVGPRPCVPYEAREFLMWHTHRFDALPGMTGLWQVSGKNKLTFSQMIRLDIAYASSMSLLNDLKIIARTLPAIITMVLESLGRKFRGEGSLASQEIILEEPMRKQAAL